MSHSGRPSHAQARACGRAVCASPDCCCCCRRVVLLLLSLCVFSLLYQNPAEADKLIKIQKGLDEVKDIMHKNIEEVLNRGETLDALMDKSEDLSATSLTFYKQSKKQNQCWSVGDIAFACRVVSQCVRARDADACDFACLRTCVRSAFCSKAY